MHKNNLLQHDKLHSLRRRVHNFSCTLVVGALPGDIQHVVVCSELLRHVFLDSCYT